MIYSLKISRRAQQDLDHIWLYTYENWSRKQANKYTIDIFSTLKKAPRNPNIGQYSDYLDTDSRKLNVNSHIIIYSLLKDEILVDRILHQSMDLEFILLNA